MSYLVTKANELYFTPLLILQAKHIHLQLTVISIVSHYQTKRSISRNTRINLCLDYTFSHRNIKPLQPTTLRTYLSYLASVHEEFGYQ